MVFFGYFWAFLRAVPVAVQNRSKLVRFWPVLHSQIWRTVTGSPVFLQFSSVQFAVILQFIELDLESLIIIIQFAIERAPHLLTFGVRVG